MLDQEQLEALLGRPLTTTEVTNLELYLDIAEETLTDLLCTDVFVTESEERKFDSRDGYSTLPVGIFTEVTTVSVDGETVDASDYVVMQNQKYNGSWYNLIVFNDKMDCDKLYSVTAAWGFGVTGDDTNAPADFQLLLARLFDLVSKSQRGDGRVQSKKIEDFSVSYRDVSVNEQFMTDNGKLIQKYSACGWESIRHGRVHTISNC